MAEVKKKIKPGQMELHPDELALLVNYEVRAQLGQRRLTWSLGSS